MLFRDLENRASGTYVSIGLLLDALNETPDILTGVNGEVVRFDIAGRTAEGELVKSIREMESVLENFADIYGMSLV